MLSRENFKEEFINLVEEGKIQVDKALDKANKEYNDNYIAHHGVDALKKFFDTKWEKRVDELFSFVEDNFRVSKEQEFINEIKEEYGFCKDFFNADIKKYFENIIEEHFKGKEIKETGWNGRIL